MRPLVMLSLLAASALAQPPGFTPGVRVQELTGRWINTFLYGEGEEPARRFWQIIDMRPDGESLHDYFSADPTLAEVLPYARVAATWEAGTFVDPDRQKGSFAVIRFAPSAYFNYIEELQVFRRIRGNFAPRFRRFSLSSSLDLLTLSESVVLEVPVDQVLSFPEGTALLLFHRLQENTAVRQTSWGRLKKAP